MIQERRRADQQADEVDAYFPLPIDKLIYVVGKQVNFDIFLKKDTPGRAEYSLFFGRGEVFEPWTLMKTKYSGTRLVYYHQRDKAKVTDYLSRSHEEGRGQGAMAGGGQGGLPVLMEEEWRVTKVATPWQPEDEYIRIRLDSLLPEWEVPFDVYVKTRVAGREQAEYIHCCPKGEVLAEGLAGKLQARGIDFIYVHQRHQNLVLHYLFQNLVNVMEEEALGPVQKAGKLYEMTLVWVRQFYTEGAKHLGGRIKMGMEFVDHLLGCIHQDQEEQNWLLGLMQHDGRLYSHCLNCCLLGLGFTKFLGWPEKKICEFGLGVLVHDIGMTQVPRQILQKPGRLSREEMELVKQHPATGVNMLAMANLSRDSLVPVLQHHENCDGSGYPNGLVLPMISEAGRVMRVVDCFEALTSRRPWREPYDTLKALLVMRQEWQQSGVFDTDYLQAFIKFLAGD